MTRQDVMRVSLTRVGAIIGIIVGGWMLLTAMASVLDDRYVRKAQYHDDVGQIKADLRVLRCKVAGDCQ